jgi:hypothetical protein
MSTLTSDFNALLIDAPVGRHFAQLHKDQQGRQASVGLFVETGVRRRKGVVVIAVDEDIEMIVTRLTAAGMDSEELRRSGQLTLLHSDAILGRFMKRGMPDWNAFRKAVGTILEGVQKNGQTNTCAYGDMVNILWSQGKPDAAIRLEEYWNDLARVYPFSLFCGYMLNSQHESSYENPLHEIGRTHSDILTNPDDDRFLVALDTASRDVFGTQFSETLSLSGRELNAGENRLPPGQRTMLWIKRNAPNRSAEVLARVREIMVRAN